MRHALTTNSKAIISSKGQVVIPKALRIKFGIHAGSELSFKGRADGVIEIKQLDRTIDMFFGRCADHNETPMSIADMDAAIMEAVLDNDSGEEEKA